MFKIEPTILTVNINVMNIDARLSRSYSLCAAHKSTQGLRRQSERDGDRRSVTLQWTVSNWFYCQHSTAAHKKPNGRNVKHNEVSVWNESRCCSVLLNKQNTNTTWDEVSHS